MFVRQLAALALLAAATALAQEPPRSGRALIDHHAPARDGAPADDTAFLARVCADLTGAAPADADKAAFLADPPAERRAKLVDRILASDAHAAHWARLWVRDLVGDVPRAAGLEAAIRDVQLAVAKNTPLDQLARHAIAAAGTWEPAGDPKAAPPAGLEELVADLADDDIATRAKAVDALARLGARAVPRLQELLAAGDIETRQRAREALDLVTPRLAPYYVVATTRPAGDEPALEIADRFTRVFLGTTLRCAKCHDHPYDEWTQDDRFRIGAFFVDARTRRLDGGGFEVADNPVRGALARPDGRRVTAFWKETPRAGETSRAAFARMLTEREKLRFARAVVNRVWARLFGRGLVEPVDNAAMRGTSLLTALAKEFAGRGFDGRWLAREVAGSAAYGAARKSPPPPKSVARACPGE